MAVANVVARFTADTGDFHRKMGDAQNSFGAVADAATMSSRSIAEFGQKMSDVGKQMTIGVTLPLIGAGAAATATAMSFESAMNKIVGLVGIASEEVAAMGDEVLGMAGSVGKAPEELASGLFVITSAGLRGAEAMSTLQASAKAGAAGLGETNDIARAVSGALSAYGSEVLSASEATDAIVATARAGNFETSQFAAAIGRVLPFAQQAGASFQEMGGAVALLTRVNGNAAESITQIQALFRAFVVPTEEAKRALDEVGMSAGDLRASIAEKGLPATLAMLDDALGGNREQLGRLLGSSEAASAAFQILNADANTINDTFGVVQDSAGMTAEAFASVSQTTQFQLSQTMAELKAALVSIGESLLPVVKSVLDFAQRWISAFNSLPAPIKNIMVIMAGLVAAIGPLLLVVGKLIVVFSTLLSFMMKMKAFQTLRNSFMKVRAEMALTRTSMKQTQASMGLMATTAKVVSGAVVGSFRAIATAAKGLLASLGPIGIALLAVGGAIEIFMGRAAAAQHHIENLRDEIDLTTGAMTQAGRVFMATELRHNISQEDLDMMAGYGVTIEGFISALEQGGPALDEYRSRIDAMREAQAKTGGLFDTGVFNVTTVSSIDTIVENLDGMIGYYDQAKLAAEDSAKAQAEAAGIAGEASKKELATFIDSTRQKAMQRDIDVRAAQDAARMNARSFDITALGKSAADQRIIDSQRAVDDAMESGIDAIEGLAAAFQNMQDVMSDEASVDKAYRSINRLNDQMAEGKNEIKGYSDEALDNRQAIRDAAQAWIDYAAATDDPEEAQKRLAEGQKEIREALKANDLDPNDSKIFEMFKNQRLESKETVDEFAKQRDKASEYGHDVGTNFIDGIIAELNRRREEVAAAAANNTSGLNTGGNAGIDATSPSRTAMKVAGNWVDGLLIGMRSRSGEVEGEASKMALRLARQFERLMQPPSYGGPATSAFQAMFGTREDIKNSSRALQDATWALADARDAVFEAEKRLNEARKEGNAREIAAAERDLARARRDAADAADAKKMAEFNAQNQEALLALEKITQKYDYITNALQEVTGSLQALSDLVATPFGLDSALSGMFGAGMDVNALASNFAQVEQMITDAFAVLIDPEIVGRKAARTNRRTMNRAIRYVETYVAEIIALRQEYDANLEKLAANEEQWRIDEKRLTEELNKVTRAYDEATRDLERIVNERDGFVSKIEDGFRKFVNNLSGLTAGATKEVTRETRELANGVRLITQVTEREQTSAAGAIANNLRDRLAEVREFSANIRTLMNRGLDPAMIRDFIESGVSGAGETVAALAGATDAELQNINETQAALLQHAQEFASQAGEDYYGALIAEQRGVVAGLKAEVDQATQELEDARAEYEAERARLEAENERIAGQIEALALEIEAIITELAATLPNMTQEAGQKAVDDMIAAFEEKFPEMKRRFGKLMDDLAKSMRRTVVIDVQTRGVGAPRSNARSFNTGTIPLAEPGRSRSVTVSSNAVNVTVNGSGGDSRMVAEDVRRAVNESLQELAREIAAA